MYNMNRLYDNNDVHCDIINLMSGNNSYNFLLHFLIDKLFFIDLTPLKSKKGFLLTK